MKIAESWLREWVNPDFDTEELAHQLTMLGHEVDDIDDQGARASTDVVDRRSARAVEQTPEC